MHKLSDDDFVSYLREEVFSSNYLKLLKPLVLERMSRFDQFVDQNSFFFSGGLKYDQVEVLPKGKEIPQVQAMLEELVEKLDEQYDWDTKTLHDTLDAHRNQLQWKPKDYFMTVRMIVTGRKDSPPLFETLEVVGREMVRFRIRDYLNWLKQHPASAPV